MIFYASGVSSPILPRDFKGTFEHENVMLSFARIYFGDRDQIAMLAEITLDRRMAKIKVRKREKPPRSA